MCCIGKVLFCEKNHLSNNNECKTRYHLIYIGACFSTEFQAILSTATTDTQATTSAQATTATQCMTSMQENNYSAEYCLK